MFSGEIKEKGAEGEEGLAIKPVQSTTQAFISIDDTLVATIWHVKNSSDHVLQETLNILHVSS